MPSIDATPSVGLRAPDAVQRQTLSALLWTGFLLSLPSFAFAAFAASSSMASDDDGPLAGLGFLIALIVVVPALIGLTLTTASLLMRRMLAGALICAGIGAAVQALALLVVLGFWLPGFL